LSVYYYYLDNPTDYYTSRFLSLLSSFNLTQHVNFQIHNKNHILDLVITSSDSSLAPSLSMTYCTPSDHFPIFTNFLLASHFFLFSLFFLFVAFTGFTPLTLTPSFLTFNLLDSSQILLHLLALYLISYNTTLSSLLDKHALIIYKLSKRRTKSNTWFTPTLHAFRSKVRHAETVYKYTHSAHAWLSFKSLKNCYHILILIAKKKFYSNLVSSSSNNPHRLWQTVNKLLHRKSTSPLPTFSSSVTLPDRFASFLLIKFLNYISLFLLIPPRHLRTVLLHQLHLLISPL